MKFLTLGLAGGAAAHAEPAPVIDVHATASAPTTWSVDAGSKTLTVAGQPSQELAVIQLPEVKPAERIDQQLAVVTAPGDRKGPEPVVQTIREPRLFRPSIEEPSDVFFLLDTSGSMGRAKSAAVNEVTNQTLRDLEQQAKDDGEISDLFNVGIFSYADGVENMLAPAFGGQKLVPISQIAKSEFKVATRGAGDTMMHLGFAEATAAIQGKSQEGRLTLLVNVTDGNPNLDPTAQVREFAESISQKGGQVLVTNIHIDSDNGNGSGVMFPTWEEVSKLSAHAINMWKLSSEVPASLIKRLKLEGKPGARMMAYNVKNQSDLLKIFQAGSSSATK